MGYDLQAKVLRVLQEKRVRRIGGTEYIDLDVRVIGATNVNLEELIRQNQFREDLYYRLCVFPIVIPDLQSRQGDIRVLVDYFLSKYNADHHTQITIADHVYDALERYRWPGNVREVQNNIEYLAGIDDDGVISMDDLPNKLKSSNEQELNISLREHMRIQERKILKQYLFKYGSSVEQKKLVAQMLGISIATLYNKLRDYDMLTGG